MCDTVTLLSIEDFDNIIPNTSIYINEYDKLFKNDMSLININVPFTDTITLVNTNFPFLIDTDNVNHPKHYTKGMEVIEFIKNSNIDFVRGNIIKYISRYRYKNGIEDLKKAEWYCLYLINNYDNFKLKHNVRNINKYTKSWSLNKLETKLLHLVLTPNKFNKYYNLLEGIRSIIKVITM
jgi:hypothetical protein